MYYEPLFLLTSNPTKLSIVFDLEGEITFQNFHEIIIFLRPFSDYLRFLEFSELLTLQKARVLAKSDNSQVPQIVQKFFFGQKKQTANKILAKLSLKP